MAYFQRLDANRFAPTEHVGGAWNAEEQHVAPVFGLLAHALEEDHRARHARPLQLARLSYDILGPLPLGPVEIALATVRPGRSIELMEGRLSHGGRTAILVRGWFAAQYPTAPFAASAFPPITSPEEMAPWDATRIWPGGFIASIEGRRAEARAGAATGWLRSDLSLISGETVSATARLMGLVDVANGVAPLVSPKEVAFPNLDLTVHFFREPSDQWLGLQTGVSIGPAGLGLTHSVLHDLAGPFGTASQLLTVRPPDH